MVDKPALTIFLPLTVIIICICAIISSIVLLFILHANGAFQYTSGNMIIYLISALCIACLFQIPFFLALPLLILNTLIILAICIALSVYSIKYLVQDDKSKKKK